MPDPDCPACPPRRHAVPATPGAQAAYMARLAEVIEARIEGDIPDTVLADICRAVAVIGQGVARADEAYIRGLADCAKARRAAEDYAPDGRPELPGED